ncbi:hypothetical protein [Thalassolituus marinus]|uniref:DUF2946 domain-containing protein n=1 Tax=Thalassolituus marinus TaxID=671053 RepID=A0ABS7ZSH7_9GAMM|nr:hypothetical protein [Thalassolituus marinus]MCA6064203.1 hypothetical protein [Thalassolituus marinus]
MNIRALSPNRTLRPLMLLLMLVLQCVQVSADVVSSSLLSTDEHHQSAAGDLSHDHQNAAEDDCDHCCHCNGHSSHMAVLNKSTLNMAAQQQRRLSEHAPLLPLNNPDLIHRPPIA